MPDPCIVATLRFDAAVCCGGAAHDAGNSDAAACPGGDWGLPTGSGIPESHEPSEVACQRVKHVPRAGMHYTAVRQDRVALLVPDRADCGVWLARLPWD